MATSRRSPGSRPSGGGAARRPAGRTSRPAARSTRSTGRPRATVEPGTKNPGATGSNAAGRDRATPPRKPGRPSVTGRAAVLALVLAVLLVSYAYPLRTWFEQHGERAELEREAAQLESSVERLERELRLWEDPAYVEAMARQRLNFVMPDEQGYVVVADPEAEESAVDEDGLPPAGEGEWYERLWTSVEVADTPPPKEGE
ncbi:cell division protein FtsB [Haloactinopolyspora alba]|uniref:Cell division protein FtsB n=1 Tax=Haloactinopolyspora alba TaxID=648780 RepID=A0A2P8E5Q3_9ACTN|nr:septum formation initiator family protein [Haloactinopolyspora alba]PSL04805.1 cell division protein FtsB [Haloactinopolyspora alba]